MPLEYAVVPCLKDNYAYLIHDPVTGATGVVDVPEAAPILAALAHREWRLTDILLTHHHDDHIAGVAALKAATGGTMGAKVWGAEADRHRLPRLDWSLWEGDKVTIPAPHFSPRSRQKCSPRAPKKRAQRPEAAAPMSSQTGVGPAIRRPTPRPPGCLPHRPCHRPRP